MSGHSPQGPGHSEDFHFRPVLVLIPISMIILVVYVITVGVWSTSALSNEMRKKQAEGAGAEPMRAQLMTLRAHEDSVLTEYRWIDKEKGIVQLPIARAMELLLQESAHQADSAQTAAKPNPTVKPKKK